MRSVFALAILCTFLVSAAIAQSAPSAVNVQSMGAKADGATDDTAAIQAAIDKAAGLPVYLPAGKYVVSKPLTYHTRGYQPAIKIFGDGIMETQIIAKLQGGAVFDVDGSGVPNQFQMGGYIRDLSIEGANKPEKAVSGIRLTAAWMLTIERVRIKQLTGDAIVVPLRTDFGANPDLYNTEFLDIRQSELSANGGWGFHGENGLGSGNLLIEQCRIGVNATGGVYTAAHNVRIIDNLIFSNGENNNGGGLVVDYVQTGGNGLIVEDNEFDGNFAFHIWVKSADTFRIVSNRMNSWEIGGPFKDGALHPATHIRLGDNGRVVRDFLISQNYHRSQRASTGARADHDLTLYEIVNNGVVGTIERPWIPAANNTPKLNKLDNGPRAKIDFHDQP